MKNRDKKLAVLMAVKQSYEPISLPNLLKKLGPDFAERTVRRWLNEMSREGTLIKIGAKRGTHYQIASHVQSSIFDETSHIAIKRIQQPLFTRDPVSYRKKWLDSYQPNIVFYLSDNQRNLLYTEGQRDTNKNNAGTYARKINKKLLID
jgi:hypothetical protein